MRDFLLVAMGVLFGGLGYRVIAQCAMRRRPAASRELQDVAAILERLDGIEASVRRMWKVRRRLE